jgi:hypothetical protein
MLAVNGALLDFPDSVSHVTNDNRNKSAICICVLYYLLIIIMIITNIIYITEIWPDSPSLRSCQKLSLQCPNSDF